MLSELYCSYYCDHSCIWLSLVTNSIVKPHLKCDLHVESVQWKALKSNLSCKWPRSHFCENTTWTFHFYLRLQWDKKVLGLSPLLCLPTSHSFCTYYVVPWVKRQNCLSAHLAHQAYHGYDLAVCECSLWMWYQADEIGYLLSPVHC